MGKSIENMFEDLHDIFKNGRKASNYRKLIENIFPSLRRE